MLWLALAVQWIHMLGGVFWMGGYLFGFTYVSPILRTLPGDAESLFLKALQSRATPAYPIIIATTGVAGIVRGTVFGPIRDVGALTTRYGLTFLPAIVFGLLAFFPFKPAWLVRAGGEHIGFFGAFTCVTFMHFGL
ncbi:MAG: hypothetical protein M3Z13_01455 [Candidatus Dormibacteraeota bacterium]|nr:hypothetical protein [Candidatus Dormibacteraeota bacterium]